VLLLFPDEHSSARITHLSRHREAFLLAAPPLTDEGPWREIHSNVYEEKHTAEDKSERSATSR
jgi:hypothetical protein